MKKTLKLAGILFVVAVVGVGVLFTLLPWMDRWGAAESEIAASFPGDELVPSPRVVYNRAVTIHASPEQIYPWIVQLGAERGGMYSYSWFETNILQCELVNADRIHEEWQDLNVGDKVKMCPGESGPPAYEVALLEPNSAVVLGHYEEGQWLDVWQFILIPHTDGTTRLVLRSRDVKSGLLWDVIRPGEFIMSRGMLLGIRERAERLAATGSLPPPVTPTPEVFIPLDQAIPGNETVSLSEFGATISLSYDPAVLSPAETGSIPAVPASDQILFSESHPAYAQIRFPNVLEGRPYDLPLLPVENRVAQVMIFRTADFPGYGDDQPTGFVKQSQALAQLLEAGIAPDRCVQPLAGDDALLPFLPWVNSRQSFCAQPQILEFIGGRGIRYLTHYSQSLEPVLDRQVFYTFQGLTEDRQFYVSAVFPVQTGIFPTEPPACPKCGEPDYDPFPEWKAMLTEQLIQLNAQPAEMFLPSLSGLDELIASIQVIQ